MFATPLVALFAGLAGMVAEASAFQIHVELYPLVTARIDPISDPGRVSEHVHHIFGSPNLRSVINQPEEQQRAVCNKNAVTPDKSNYWMPATYFINEQNKYEAMIPAGGRAYYLGKNHKDTHPFPPGFRMVSGTPMKRDLYDPRVAGVGFSCDRTHSTGFLPNGTTHKGCSRLMTRVTFPSCGWANQSLDSWDHNSHMTWPVWTGGNVQHYDTYDQHGQGCPESHPIKYPVLNLEVYYQLRDHQKAQWRTGNRANFILSNGDTLGPSLHADFVNGWDQKVLTDIIAANCASQATDHGSCPPVDNNSEFIDSRNCRYMGMVPDEEVGYVKPLDKLPGCNRRWDVQHGNDKPTDCERTQTPGWTAPNAVVQVGNFDAIPVAVDVGDLPLTVDGLRKIDMGKVNGDKIVLDPYSQQTKTAYNRALPNEGQFWSGTKDDIRNNKNAKTAKNKIDKVFGMKDASAFTKTTPAKSPPKRYLIAKNQATGHTWVDNQYGKKPPPKGHMEAQRAKEKAMADKKKARRSFWSN